MTEKIFEVSDCESLSTCESCLLEKITKSPFTEKGEQANEILGLIYTDVCGSMSTNATSRYYYFIIFIDDLSRYGHIYLRHINQNRLKYSNDSVMK